MRLDGFLAPRSANHRPLTPVQFLWRTAALHPEQAAVIDGGRELRWQELAELVRRFAGALLHRGVAPGDVVSIVALNCMEMLAAHYAVPMAGAVLNAINTRLDAATLAYIVGHAQSRLLIAHSSCRRVIDQARREHQVGLPVVWIGDRESWPADACALTDLLADTRPLQADAIFDEWQPISLNYTSGTTGRPKGVLYHHRGAYLNALGNVLAMGFNERTRYLWVLPMFHCNGWSHTWAVTAAGGTHVCVERVDAAQILGHPGCGGDAHERYCR